MLDANARVTGLYIHVQRLTELLGGFMPPSHLVTASDTIQKGVFFGRVTEQLVTWLADVSPPTLGQRVLDGTLKPGAIFTHFGAFRCRGMSEYLQEKRRDLPEVYVKLDEFKDGLRLVARIDPAHTTSVSAAGEFRGQQRFFVVGLVDRIDGEVVEIKLYFVGLIVDAILGGGAGITLPRWRTFGEVWPTEIDPFEKALRVRRPALAELSELQLYREEEIKAAFADIIGEPFIPKDWGGEVSDLYSSRLSIGALPVAASFVFKGPSKFHPMKITDLGVNGDQIIRMFYDPADIFVVQHCHQVTPAVRLLLRALANQVGRTRLFCVIDGADTLRILRAYKKLVKTGSSRVRKM